MLSHDQAAGLRNGISRLVKRLHQGDIDDYTDEKLAIWYEVFRPLCDSIGLHDSGTASPFLSVSAAVANPLSREEFEDHLMRIIRQGTDRGEYVLDRLLRAFLEQS